MELIDKVKDIISRLEDIRNQNNPNIEIIREQIDFIENEEFMKLIEEFNEFIRLYDAGEPDEETNKLIDKIEELVIHADELIATIRQHFDIEYVYDDINDLDDDELNRTALDDDKDYNDVEYDIVLNEVSKSALITIGIDN